MAKKSLWTVPRKTTTLDVYEVEAQNATEAAVIAGLMERDGDKPVRSSVIGVTWLGAQKVIADEPEGGKKS